MEDKFLKTHGPLAFLIGVWEGEKGDDTSPSDERGVENNRFRERLIFEPIGPVQNHEQVLYGLRYSTTAWKLGENDPFHEELGYWLWDAKEQQVMRCFMVPRGVAVIAGGTVKKEDREYSLKASLGSLTYGICSNLFLDKEFKTVGYALKIKYVDDNKFSYEEDTQIQMKGRKDIFHHIDKNTVQRVK